VNLKQMEEYVINPALNRVGLWRPGAVRMLLYTGWVESRYEYVAQVGGGPARSFWQVERSTMDDHYKNYLDFRPLLKEKIDRMAGDDRDFQLTFNMGFAVVMARLKYYRSQIPMPKSDNLEAQARFWKKVYNTEKGAGTTEQFIQMCRPLEKELYDPSRFDE